MLDIPKVPVPGGHIENTTYQTALEKGVAPGVAGAALKAAAIAAVENVAEAYRAQLASASAAKLAAYKIKEGHAADPNGDHIRALAVAAGVDPDDAVAGEAALLEREAVARGVSVADLTVMQAAMALAYRKVALTIEVLEAEAKMAIAAIPDDEIEIEPQIAAALEVAKAQAELAFSEAQTLINGGS